MTYWSAIGDAIWWILTFFVFVVYLMALFSIIGDVFRDRNLNGFFKALWLIFLIFVPFLTAIVYLIARGRGMSERAAAQAAAAQASTEDYIRSVTGSAADPTAQIARAKDLLDAGAIDAEEYAALKRVALQQVK